MFFKHAAVTNRWTLARTRPHYATPAHTQNCVAIFPSKSPRLYIVPNAAKSLHELAQNLLKNSLHLLMSPAQLSQCRVLRVIERVRIRIFLLCKVLRGGSLPSSSRLRAPRTTCLYCASGLRACAMAAVGICFFCV